MLNVGAVVLSSVVIGQLLMLLLFLVPGQRADTPRRWLVVAVLALGLNALGDLAAELRSSGSFVLLESFSSGALLWIGPAFLLHVRQLTGDAVHWRRGAVHFVPGLLIAAALVGGELLVPVEATPVTVEPAIDDLLVLVPFLLHLFGYLVRAMVEIRASRRQVMHEFSSLAGRTLSWLQFVIALVMGVAVIWLAGEVSAPSSRAMLAPALMALALTVVGVRGVHQTEVRSVEAAAAASGGPASVSKKYARAPLAPELIAGLGARLQRCMRDDRPHLDMDLSLRDLAGRLDVSPHALSQFLSQHVGLTFYDFINRARVEAAQRALDDPTQRHRSVLVIAYDCGFGSKSTFNATFRRVTGMSPLAWRDRRASADRMDHSSNPMGADDPAPG